MKKSSIHFHAKILKIPLLLRLIRLRAARLHTAMHVITKLDPANSSAARQVGFTFRGKAFTHFRLAIKSYFREIDSETPRSFGFNIRSVQCDFSRGSNIDLLIGKLDELHRRAIQHPAKIKRIRQAMHAL